MSEGKYGAVLYSNHTYKALRVISEDYNLLDTLWWCGELRFEGVLYHKIRDVSD